MKKHYILFSVIAALLTLTLSCNNDDDNNTVFSQMPEEGAAGVYAGTFQRVQVGAAVPDTTYSEGTMTVTAEKPYAANISYKCDEFSINHGCIANISHSNNGYVFSNNLGSNALGDAFLGNIYEDGTAKSHLTLKIRSGRNTKTFDIVFKGNKTGNAESGQ